MKLPAQKTKKHFQNIADISAGFIIVNKPGEDQIKVAIVQRPFKSTSSFLPQTAVNKIMKKMTILYNFL